jgi:hypothetical protein
VGFGFHHHDGVNGACHDEVELGFAHFIAQRVQHELAVDETDAGGGDRAEEWHARQGQGGGGGDEANDVGVILVVE